MRRPMLKVATFFALVLLAGGVVTAADDGKAIYTHGSVKNIKNNTKGVFSTSDPEVVVFGMDNAELRILYSSITSRTLGHAVPLLLKHRISGTPIRSAYRDAEGKEVTAVFEAEEQIPVRILDDIGRRIGARSGQAITIGEFNR